MFNSVCLGIVLQFSCISIAGANVFYQEGCFNGSSIDNDQGLPLCYIPVDLGTSGHIMKPAVGWTDTTVNNAAYKQATLFLQVENEETQRLIVCPLYLKTSAQGRFNFLEMERDAFWTDSPEDYSTFIDGGTLSPTDVASIATLMSIPCGIVDSELVRLTVLTDASSVDSMEFDLIYFSQSKFAVRPINSVRIAVPHFMETLAIPVDTSKFTVEVIKGYRIWLRAVYLNLTSSADEVILEKDCRYSPVKVEIYKNESCYRDECLLARLCRSPFSMVPVTLVTEENTARFIIFCNQMTGIDCAFITYRVYKPDLDIGSCPDETNKIEEFIELEEDYNFEYNFTDPNRTLQYVWHFKNMFGNVTQISVTDNTLDWSPNCSSERVEIYNGECVRPEDLVTYFCDGLREVYMLTASPFITIKVVGDDSKVFDTDGFSLFLQVQNRSILSLEQVTDNNLFISIVATECVDETDMNSVLIGSGAFVLLLIIIPAIRGLFKIKKRRKQAIMPQLPMAITPLPEMTETPKFPGMDMDDEFGALFPGASSFGSKRHPFLD